MGKLFAFAFVAFVGFIGYLYVSGPTKGDLDSSAREAGGTVTDGATGGVDWATSQPAFGLAAGSGLVAMIGFMTWRRINGWGRGVVLVAAAVAITVAIMRAG